jgi:general secretion pathway protein D
MGLAGFFSRVARRWVRVNAGDKSVRKISTPTTARPSPFIISVAALATLGGCASFPALRVPVSAGPRENSDAGEYRPASGQRPSAAVQVLSGANQNAPVQATETYSGATLAQVEQLLTERDVQVALPPQPLPQFIDTVFGGVLQVPYSTGPGVAQRREMIALRGPSTISNRQFFAMAQAALQQYGVAVVIENGSVRVLQDAVLSGQSPVFIRSRTLPDTPNGSRPVMQFFSVSTLDVASLVGLLDQAYPNRGAVRFTPQPETNTLLISGSAREVASAAAVVAELDRPHFANGQIARVEPIFLSTDQLADALTRVLATEGYRVSNPVEGRPGSINLLSVPNTNQMLVFANDAAVFDRALYWVSQLDRASAMGSGEGLFVYNARYASAEQLGQLVTQANGADTNQTPAQNPPEVAVRRINGERIGARPAQSTGAPTTAGGITIDPSGNRLLYRGTPSDFERLRILLEQIDVPPQQVLIELTVAEVTLTDETQFGFEWTLERLGNSTDFTATTAGGTVRQPGGLGISATHVFSRGTVEAAFNAFANNRNINILSTPRIVTRSGAPAEFVVGTDVPVITSQRASNSQSGGDTDVLQTVQYRQTGVILNVRPTVYGDGRIDIELYQEVSSEQPNDSADINSPLILNRSVTTQLSLQEGMTAVIGGLMQDNYTREQGGIPGLKDIPLIGAAFRNDSVSGDKTELVILVTPYIIRDAEDMAELTSAMTNSVNRAFRHRGTQVYTMYPWQSPFAGVRDHAVEGLNRPAAARPAPAPAVQQGAPPVAAPSADEQTPSPEPQRMQILAARGHAAQGAE